MNYSNRFLKISQLLFTSDISDQEKEVAQQVVDMLDKIHVDLERWIEGIVKNLDIIGAVPQDKEAGLVGWTENYEKMVERQKEKYEKMIQAIKQSIEIMNGIQDIEMQDMVTNLTKASESFTEIYNELADLPIKIGEEGFVQKFKDASKNIIDNDKPFLEVIQRIRDYIMKNIIGARALS